jgi:hypothetical protein
MPLPPYSCFCLFPTVLEYGKKPGVLQHRHLPVYLAVSYYLPQSGGMKGGTGITFLQCEPMETG